MLTVTKDTYLSSYGNTRQYRLQDKKLADLDKETLYNDESIHQEDVKIIYAPNNGATNIRRKN